MIVSITAVGVIGATTALGAALNAATDLPKLVLWSMENTHFTFKAKWGAAVGAALSAATLATVPMAQDWVWAQDARLEAALIAPR